MKTMLIRAEDKNRWERRAPLVPSDLAAIVRDTGARAFVERSDKRVFDTAQYLSAGATACEEMTAGDIVFGIKEIPVDKLVDRKVYLFFSHTIKGQKNNMPLLQRIIDSGSTLIDYERITDAHGRRLIFFGPYAGDAGAIDLLSLMGENWAHKGIDTPFAAVKRAHQYDSLEAAMTHLARIGRIIRRDGLPRALTPFTVGFLGYGNVSQGAQRIFDCLPTERVAPDDIPAVASDGKADRHTLYLSIFTEQDLVSPTDPTVQFDLPTYYDFPERYESRFEPFLPHFRLLINAVYWEARYPRFVTWSNLKRLFTETPAPRLAGIADISCDTNGSIECNVKSTDSDRPAYRVDPLTGTVSDGHVGDGIVLLAVDNLPCELPRDASTFFSGQLKPLVPALLAADFGGHLDTSGLPDEIKRAVIVYNGRLTPDYEYLNAHLKAARRGSQMTNRRAR